MKCYDVIVRGSIETKHRYYNYSEALSDYEEYRKKIDWGRVTLLEVEETELKSKYIPQYDD